MNHQSTDPYSKFLTTLDYQVYETIDGQHKIVPSIPDLQIFDRCNPGPYAMADKAIISFLSKSNTPFETLIGPVSEVCVEPGYGGIFKVTIRPERILSRPVSSEDLK